MNACPFFGKCGGCRLDFSEAGYRAEKLKLLGDAKPDEIVWIEDKRRRAEFSFLDGEIGFFARGTNDIVPIAVCPMLCEEINAALRGLPTLPGTGGVLITKCDNGIAIDVNSSVRFYPPELKDADAGRVTWNNRIVRDGNPLVFGRMFRPNGFLQPTKEGENVLRIFTAMHARGKIADLFCGIGTLTMGLDADGFDIFDNGQGNIRNLFRNPLSAKELRKYDAIVLDPPRAGAKEQCIRIAKASAPVVYVSCNPKTWARDRKILENTGYKCVHLVAVDQFPGSTHWELASAFEKR
ncbi:MAG: hypothetical protein LBT45_00595 [Rickettsiales bacterium]|jgi:23S rRNA (uracil1939-C5)-methyltransferase|nr:hypothetical protein [Rickettsiales bacterium]